MTNPSRAVVAVVVGASLSLWCGLGCGGSSSSKGDGGIDSGTDTGSSPDLGVCPTTGANGTLSVKIQGTPGSVGSVSVAGTASQTLTTSIDLSSAPGAYTITAARVASAAPLVRIAYEPSVDAPLVCVHTGATTTVTVSYTAIATSNHLWAGNSGAGKDLLGFSPASLAASGSPPADLTAGTVGSAGFTFDAAGNMWVIGGTTADPPLARYPASSFRTSGAKTPDVTIQSSSFGTGVPGAQALAFDSSGNLWVSVVAAGKVIRFTPAQLAASGSPVAAVEITGIDSPSGIAFDQGGNLLVAANGEDAVYRVDHSRLATSGPFIHDLKLIANTPAPVIGPLSSPIGIAFDGSGNLWVNYDGTLARLTPDDLLTDLAVAPTDKSLVPAVQVETDVLSLPEGIAFDEQGGLWLAYSAGKLARLAPTQLTASGSVVPSVVITSADIAYAGWFAIYPAPAATPLAHRLP